MRQRARRMPRLRAARPVSDGAVGGSWRSELHARTKAGRRLHAAGSRKTLPALLVHTCRGRLGLYTPEAALARRPCVDLAISHIRQLRRPCRRLAIAHGLCLRSWQGRADELACSAPALLLERSRHCRRVHRERPGLGVGGLAAVRHGHGQWHRWRGCRRLSTCSGTVSNTKTATPVLMVTVRPCGNSRYARCNCKRAGIKPCRSCHACCLRSPPSTQHWSCILTWLQRFADFFNAGAAGKHEAQEPGAGKQSHA